MSKVPADEQRAPDEGDEFDAETPLPNNHETNNLSTEGRSRGLGYHLKLSPLESDQQQVNHKSSATREIVELEISATTTFDDGFDPRSYPLVNHDLRVLTGPYELYQHWLAYGTIEARRGSGVSSYRSRRPWRGRLSSTKLKVAYYAPVSARNGLGSAARGYVKALRTLEIDLEVIDTTAALYAEVEASFRERGAKPDVVILHQNADSVANLFRLFGRDIIDDVYVIGIWVWEVLAFRSEWVESFGAVDEIWAPSDFVREGIAAAAPSGVTVRTVPHVVEAPSCPTNYDRSDFGIPDGAFTFLSLFDVSSAFERKNPLAVLEAFSEAFKNDAAAFLVMKYHTSAHDYVNLDAMRRKYSASNVLFIDKLMKPEEVTGLREVCDCLVSAHRAEGFGLNIAEAMAIGKPVIATGYSGNLQFCDVENSLLIRHDLAEVRHGTRHYPAGSVWAQPDHSALVEAMRKVATDVKATSHIGRRASEAIRSKLSPLSVAKRMQEAFDQIVRRQGVIDQHWPQRTQLAWRHPGALGSSEFEHGHWPTISIIVPVFDVPAEYLRECVVSVLEQTYPYWELCICDDGSTRNDTVHFLNSLRDRDQRIRVRRLEQNAGIASATNAAVEMSTGEYLAFLDNDDTIEPETLAYYAKAMLSNPGCDLLYCDEDKIDLEGKYVDSYFKPDWSPEHLESCMYVLHMLAVRKQVFLQLGGFRLQFTGAQDYDLALRVSALGGVIIHVPKLLYHWRMIPGSASAVVDAKPTALVNARLALEDYARNRFGPDARVEDGLLTGLFRISRGHLVRPPVTLVITTDNATKAVEGRGTINLPANFLKSIVEQTDYDNYRVLISSNGVLSSDCRSLLAETGGREIIYEGSTQPFNFADKANFSILNAETEFVVLLNDDMEVRNPGWLSALLDQIVKEDVGAVGAHLCYPDDRIQHVGMVLGVNETSAHVYHGHAGDSVGYNGFSSIVRNYSAVTGACMATRRSLFDRVGGFDRSFALDFNDTDYCLRLRELGFRIVFTPFARLYHFESQTAVRTAQDPEEKALFLSRWKDVVANDPYYNPNLRRDSISFEPSDQAWPRRVA